MEKLEQQIESYRKKMVSAESMTDLLVAMASWNSFADSRGLDSDQRKAVDEAYLKAESILMQNVQKTPW